MSKWATLSISLPGPLSTLSQLASQGLSALQTALQALKAEAQAAIATEVDPTAAAAQATNAAIQALVSALTDAINALLDDVGIYVLPIPLPKKGFVQVLQSVNPDESGSNYINFPASAVVGGLSDADRIRLQATPLWQQVLDADDTFMGGNAYFVNTLSTSVFDIGDQGRPQFQRSDTWAYALVVAGAPDMTSLGSIATFIDRSFAARAPSGTSRGTVSIVPSNPRISLSGRGLHAVLQWDVVPATRLLSSYDNSVLVATEFAVIRSTDFRAKTVIKVEDLFSSVDLTEGMTGQYGAVVQSINRYDSITTRWEDTTDLPTDGSPAYYHVAFKGELRSPATQPNAQTTPVAYGPLSRCLEITQDVRRTAGSTQGVPPDWIRTPSLATLFPPIESFLDNVSEQLNNFAAGAQTFTDRNNAYLAFMDAEIAIYESKVSAIQARIAAITAATSPPGGSGPSISVKINSGTGTVSQFVSSVVKDFSDDSDTGRPAFDTGDEFVIGAVILAVGPDPSKIAKALALFESILGAPAAPDPVIEGVRSITQAVQTVNADVAAQLAALTAPVQNTFGPDMAPASTDAGCDPAAPAAPSGFDAQMNPIP